MLVASLKLVNLVTLNGRKFPSLTNYVKNVYFFYKLYKYFAIYEWNIHFLYHFSLMEIFIALELLALEKPLTFWIPITLKFCVLCDQMYNIR